MPQQQLPNSTTQVPDGEKDKLTQLELDAIMRVPTVRRKFSAPELVNAANTELRRMVADPSMNTNPRKKIGGDKAFIDRHQLYLQKHPYMNPFHYLSNLRTMTRIRP